MVRRYQAHVQKQQQPAPPCALPPPLPPLPAASGAAHPPRQPVPRSPRSQVMKNMGALRQGSCQSATYTKRAQPWSRRRNKGAGAVAVQRQIRDRACNGSAVCSVCVYWWKMGNGSVGVDAGWVKDQATLFRNTAIRVPPRAQRSGRGGRLKQPLDALALELDQQAADVACTHASVVSSQPQAQLQAGAGGQGRPRHAHG